MKDKDLIKKAIDNYSFYTVIQRKLLKFLVENEIDNKVKSTILEINKISGISKASIYRCIDVLKLDGVLKLSNKTSSKINGFNLNIKKLNEIKESYLKKESLRKK